MLDANRIRVSMLLQSAPHISMARFLETDYTKNLKYRLECATVRGLKVIGIRPYEGVINSQTAAAYALIYACWAGDLELATDLIHDLYELIDINTLIDGHGIIYITAVLPLHNYNKAQIDRAIDICRLLIVCYGPKLDAYRQGRHFMGVCLHRDCADVVLYLITIYDEKIDHMFKASDIFRCLATNDQDEEAKQYLKHYQRYIRSRSIIIPTALKGSASMFRHVLTTFRTNIEADDIGKLFKTLCISLTARGWDSKIKIISESLVDQLTADIITKGLINNWVKSVIEAQCSDTRDRLGYMAKVIISTFMTLIQDRGIDIALALCHALQDLELLDAIIDRNLEHIRSNPGLVRHVLIECVNHRDIETFEHMLTRIGSSISADALEYWSRAGDLEAVRMILEVSMTDGPTLDRLPLVLRLACQEGDAELVEIITEFASDLITNTDYRLAFRNACMFGREQVIRVMAANCDYCLNFSTNADIYTCVVMKHFSSDLALLINSLFGTSIDPASCATAVCLEGTGNQGKAVISYEDILTHTYDLRKDSRPNTYV